MAYIAPRITQPNIPKVQFWPSKESKLDGGLDLANIEFELPEDKTNDCLNMWYKDGILDKRWGQDFIKTDELPEVTGHSIYRFLYKGLIIKHTGTKLYTQDPTTGVITEIFAGLNDAESRLFKYNGNIYLKQVGNYVQWDGVTASDVVPYIPNTVLNRLPTGGGDLDEQFNRFGAGFKNSFNGNGSDTAFTLTETDLDITAVTAIVDGVAKVEGVDFTVDRSTGVVTFTVAPLVGTNNVVITAYKTNQEDIDSILNCLAVTPFGGQNDNRLFFGNNGTGVYYWTGISSVGVDPTYFPFDNFNIVGLTDENITGFNEQQNTLLVIKERAIYAVDYNFNGVEGVFNSYPVSNVFGCNAPRTIQTVNNNTVFLSTVFGVCVVQSTNVDNQRNVFPISRNVDPRLLYEENLTEASSVIHDGNYWLCVNDKIYLWDYFLAPYYDTGNPDDNASRLSWWYFDNISAKDFSSDGLELYYIDRTSGKTVQFYITYDANQFFDFGLAYKGLYRYPFRLVGGGLYEFTVTNGIIAVRSDRKTEYQVTYFTNDDIVGELETEPISVGSFAWDQFNWSTFTWAVMSKLFNWPLRPALKNIEYFAVEFSNNEAGKSMNIVSMRWQYLIKRQIK